MEAIFLKILNMSITASWTTLVVIVLRLLLKKAPKAISVFLWALVGIRLICPFSLESVLSLIPSAETVPGDIIYSNAPTIESGIPVFNSAVNPIISESFAPEAGASVNPMQVIAFAASIVWIVGMVGMLLYTAVSSLRIYRKVQEAALLKENLWLCDRVDTPFIFGIIRPRIYLPSTVSEQDMEYVIAHEKAHLKRRDHLWKPLGFLLLTVYWFNPVLWIAYILLCRDIELACDEKVIYDMGTEIKKSYSEALINCSVPRKLISACPLAFGEVGVKGRVKSVLNYKKPAFWVIVVAIIASIAAAVCFLTNPASNEVKNIESLTPDSITEEIESLTLDSITEETVAGKQLTLDDVKSLAQKGDELTWEDFEEFSYTETGSGLYIRLYKIDEMFSLWIGGTNPDEDAWYFHLHASDARDEQIDIRTSDVEAFINEHKNNPVVQDVSWGYYSCPVDNTGDNFDKMIEISGISPDSYVSSVQSLVTVKITSVKELKSFISKMESTMNFNQSYSDAASFNDVSKEYTEEYFENTTLFLIYTSAGTSANRFSLEYATKSLGVLSIGIMESIPEAGDAVMQGWLICVGVLNDSVKDVDTVDVRISSQHYPDSGMANAEVVRPYIFGDF